MYESPIEKIYGDIQYQIIKQDEENVIYSVNQAVGYSVDKNELIKALKYDREQYNKGYRDGLNANKWIPVSERLPEKDGEYLVTASSFCGEIVFKCSFAMDLHKVDEYNFHKHKCGFYGIDSEWGSYEIDNVIAWMPSPEPYKAESEE